MATNRRTAGDAFKKAAERASQAVASASFAVRLNLRRQYAATLACRVDRMIVRQMVFETVPHRLQMRKVEADGGSGASCSV